MIIVRATKDGVAVDATIHRGRMVILNDRGDVEEAVKKALTVVKVVKTPCG